MKLLALLILFLFASRLSIAQKVMDGFPPSRESQVTSFNYRNYPNNKWSFRNMAAPLHAVMIPREGPAHLFKTASNNNIGKTKVNKDSTFENVFDANKADGVIIIRNNTILLKNIGMVSAVITSTSGSV